MIDSHVHILPGVDDGARDEEQSVYMLEKAKADGITHWIVTPHYNHACSPHTYDELKSRFIKWAAIYGNSHAKDNLLFGVEVYVDEPFIKFLKHMDKLPTFENSNYMLIEFSRAWKVEQMLEAIHELKIRGVHPVIAHVEVYPDLLEKPENVKQLADEGCMIQVSASSFLDRHYYKFLRALIQLNAVDIVASDGHDVKNRPPILSDSYRAVTKHFSKNWANRLFVDAPRKLFYGEVYVRPHMVVTVTKRQIYTMGSSVIAGLALLFIGLGQLGFLPGGSNPDALNGAMLESTEAISDATDGGFDLTDESIAAGAKEEETTEQVTVSTQAPASTGLPISATTSVPSKLTYDEIVTIHITMLELLQSDYEANVARIYEDIQNARTFISDEAKRKTAIDGYIEEAGALEAQCDIEVYDVLYKFQNALEEFDYPVDIIEESRAEYHSIKEATKQKYLNEF